MITFREIFQSNWIFSWTDLDCNYREDVLGEKVALHYLRDTEKREVAFALVNERNVELLVEVKTAKSARTRLKYLAQRTGADKAFLLLLDPPCDSGAA